MHSLFLTMLETVWRVLVALIWARTVQKFWTVFLAQVFHRWGVFWSDGRPAFSWFSAPSFAQKQSPFLTVHRVGVHPRTIFLRCSGCSESNCYDRAFQIQLCGFSAYFLSPVSWLVLSSETLPTEDSFNRIRIFQIPFNNWARSCVGAEKIRKTENIYLLKEEILDWK